MSLCLPVCACVNPPFPPAPLPARPLGGMRSTLACSLPSSPGRSWAVEACWASLPCPAAASRACAAAAPPPASCPPLTCKRWCSSRRGRGATGRTIWVPSRSPGGCPRHKCCHKWHAVLCVCLDGSALGLSYRLLAGRAPESGLINRRVCLRACAVLCLLQADLDCCAAPPLPGGSGQGWGGGQSAAKGSYEGGWVGGWMGALPWLGGCC